MTFENEEGVTRALKYDEVIEAQPVQYGKYKTWLGDEVIEIQPASEPSDIIWENRQYTPSQRLCKALIVILILAILLFLSFIVIFALSMYSYDLLNKYPYVECDGIVGDKSSDTMQSQAYLEFSINSQLEADGNSVSYAGYLQCFCDEQQ